MGERYSEEKLRRAGTECMPTKEMMEMILKERDREERRDASEL